MTPATTVVRRARWWLLCSLAFAFGLIALAPAAILEWASNNIGEANFRFAADGGTIWRGSGRIALPGKPTAGASALPTAAQLLIPVSWRFDPLALLRLRLGFFINATAPRLSGATHLGLGFNSIELRETALNADAQFLSLTNSMAALFAPAGQIRLTQSADERLVITPATRKDDAWNVVGLMGITADQFALGGAVNAAVGSHEIKLRGDGPTIQLSIPRSSGPLKLEGAGTLTLVSPRRVTFSGFATTTADAAPALKTLGPLLPDGRQRIELSANW
ncbi:MAG: type II secretion system protein N [Usitatibacteraceae bacterium]